MAPQAVVQMLEALDENDYNTVIRFIEFLLTTKKQTNNDQNTLAEIQNMFREEKQVYSSEEAMLADLAAFRRERENR